VILNLDLYRLFGRNLGRADQWGAMGLHNLYLLYSSLVFGILAACHWRRREAGDVKTVMADSSQGLPANHRQRRDRT